MTKKIVFVVLFLLCLAVFAYAGYETGLTKGKGWRAAVIDRECQLVCKFVDPVDGKI